MSPKNKGKYGRAKVSDIPETDEFISGVDRVLRALKPHATRLAILLGVVVVIVVSYTTWHWWKERKLTAASELYSRAMALSHVPVRAPEVGPDGKPGKAPPKAEDAGRMPDPRGLPDEFASQEERARAVLSVLEKLESDHESTAVAHQGLLLEAEALYQLGRYPDAIDRYRRYIDGGGSEELLLAAREGLGYSLEAQAMAEKDAKARQAGLEKTLRAFAEMQPRADGLRHDEALYHQARIQVELGRRDEARKIFEQILADHPSSSLKQDIEVRLPALRAGTRAK